jgi:hypothetical protein
MPPFRTKDFTPELDDDRIGLAMLDDVDDLRGSTSHDCPRDATAVGLARAKSLSAERNGFKVKPNPGTPTGQGSSAACPQENYSTLRGLAQQLRAGRGRDFEDVKCHRNERVVADEPAKIDDALVAPACAHPFVDVVA